MRRKAGDSVSLFNGRDGEWSARVSELRRDGAVLAVERQLRLQSPKSAVGLAFALLKRDATDWLVQKATELGAGELWPLTTERTSAERLNSARLAAIAREAAEQSERLDLPTIHGVSKLPDFLAAWTRGRTLFAAIERQSAAFPPPAGEMSPALLVGPEGGFTQAELDLLGRHPFVEPITLGPRILRAETAAIAGLALLQAPPRG